MTKAQMKDEFEFTKKNMQCEIDYQRREITRLDTAYTDMRAQRDSLYTEVENLQAMLDALAPIGRQTVNGVNLSVAARLAAFLGTLTLKSLA